MLRDFLLHEKSDKEGVKVDPMKDTKLVKTGQKSKQVESKDMQILCLVSSRDLDSEESTARIDSYKKHAKRKGMKFIMIVAEDATVTVEDDKIKIFDIDNYPKGIEIRNDNTMVVMTVGMTKITAALNVLSQLERYHFFCINFRETIDLCADKFKSYMKMQDNGIITPRTALVPNVRNLDKALKFIGGKFPVILKTTLGAQGVGVVKVDDYGSLKSTLELIWKEHNTAELLIQEYIDLDFDIRVHVVGGVNIIAAMKRTKAKNDFRTNISGGGEAKEHKLKEDEIEMALRCANAVDSGWCGVDLARSKKTGKLYCLEINTIPGTKGINSVGFDVVKDVVDYYSDRENWKISTTECGVIESMEILGVGKLICKMDTGNSAYCVIHGNDIKITDNEISWTDKFGKKHKDEIIEIVSLKNKENEEAEKETGEEIIHGPLINLSVKFDGMVHYDVPFIVKDRENRTTPVLINRKFIVKGGLIINPAKKYVLSKKQ